MSYHDEYLERKKKRNEETGYTSYHEGFIERQIKRGRINLEDEVSRLNDDIQSWWKAHDEYVSGYKNRFAGENTGYRTDSQDYLDGVRSQKQSLSAQQESIRQRLSDYGKYLDSNWVNEVTKALDDSSATYNSILLAASQDNKYWSQYADEDEYVFYSMINDGNLEGAEEFLQEKSEGKRVTTQEIDWMATIGNALSNAFMDKQQGAQTVYKDVVQLYTDEKLQKYWDILNYYKNEKAYNENNADYLALKGNADFADNSKYVSTKTGNREIDWLATIAQGIANGAMGVPGVEYKYKDGQGYGDIIYDIINGNEEAKRYVDEKNLSDYGALAVASGLASTEYLTELKDDEKEIFNYLYATEGPERAYEYISHLEKNYLNERSRNTIEQKWAEMAKKAPVLTSLLTIGAAPARGISYISQAADFLQDGKIDDNARYNQLLYSTNAVRNQVSKQIEESGKWGEVGSFAYGVAMSMGDFLSSSVAGLGNGTAVGLIMATSAAADTTLQGIDRGLDSPRAFLMGTIAGAAEFFTEKMRIDDLLDMALLSKSKFTYVLKNTLSEGAEEGVTDIINWGADWLYDVISGQSKSEWKAMIAEYEAMGYTSAEAFGKAVGDRMNQLGTDVLAGAVSGGIMGGAGAGFQAISEYKTGASYKSNPSGLINDALNLNPESELAQELKGKLDAGEKVKQGALGKLSNETQETAITKLSERDAATKKRVIAEIEKKISAEISDKKVRAQVAETLTKIAYGEHVSNAELRKVANSKKALKVISELTGTKYKAGEVTVRDLRQAITPLQKNSARLSSANVLATYAAHYNMDEIAERSLMVSYANDTKNAGERGVVAPEVYAEAYNKAYVAGKKGTGIAEISGKVSSVLSDSAIAQAYRAGEMVAQSKNSQKGLSNGAESGTINTVNKEAQDGQQQEGVRLRDGGERNDGKNSGGQVSGLEGGAREAEEQGSGSSQEDRAARIRAYVEAEGLEKVSTRSLGPSTGTDKATAVVIPESGHDDGMRQIATDQAKQGRKVVFVSGPLEIVEDGEIVEARGLISADGKTMWIQADSDVSPEQIALHEEYHAKVKSDPSLIERMKRKVLKKYKGQLDVLIRTYANLYYQDAPITEDLKNSIIEEIFADAYAGIDVLADFDGAEIRATDFQDTIRDGAKNLQNTRAPPSNSEVKASRSTPDIYTATSDFAKNVVEEDRSAFTGQLSSKTKGIGRGKTRVIAIYAPQNIYLFVADGYMTGKIGKILSSRTADIKQVATARKDILNEIDTDTEIANLWTKAISNSRGRARSDISLSSRRRVENAADDRLSRGESRGDVRGNNEQGGRNNYSIEEIEAILQPLKEMYGVDDNGIKASRTSKSAEEIAKAYLDAVPKRMILANALESVASSESDKRELRKYKSRVKALDAMEAELSEVNAKIRELSFAPGPRDKITLNEFKQRKTELESAIQKKDKSLIMLEATAPLQSVLERAKKQAVAKAKEEARVKMDAQKERAREALDKQAKRYQESRKKSVEGRHKTDMRHKIQRVVSELDKLLRKGNKERNVKLGLQDAVAAALEAFDINAEKVARYERDMANLDQKIAEATDPIEIEALQALRDKKQRNSELLADKLLVMKKAYEDIHNNAGDVNYPAHYRAEAKVIGDRISSVLEKVGNVPISEMSLEQLESVYDMYRMVLTTVRDANKAFINGKLEDLSENAADMTAELQKIKKLPEERLRAGDDARAFVWNELTPYYAFKRIGSKTLMRYYDELVRGQDVYARDLDEAKSFAEDLRKKHGSKKWNRNEVKIFKDRDGRDFRLNLGQMMSIYAYSKREQAFDHMEKGGFFFNNKETFRTDKTGILKFVASNESGYKIDAAIFAKIKAALTSEQIAYVDEMQAYLTAMGEKGNEVSRQMWGIDIFKEKVYFPLKSKEDFIYQANTPAETSSLKNDGMTKETKPHASNPIVLESFDEVWANHVNKMSMYHGFVIPIDNLNKLINYGSWMESKKITSGMSDAQRYSILKDRVIENVPKAGTLKPGAEAGISNWGDIDKLMGKEKRDVIHKIASEFGVFKGYENKDVEISFDFTNNSFRETYSKQGKRYTQFAKLFSVFDQVVEKAVGIETHNRNNTGYKQDPTLKNVYVLMSAFEDGNNIIPVKLEVKEFNDKQNTLYVAITMNAIEKAEVWKSGSSNTDVAPNSRSANISISQIFEKINTSDQSFLKYVPDGFLNAEQIDAKKQALAKDGVKYSPSSSKDLSGFEMGSHSISTMLEARFSHAVNDYLNTFIKDLNGAKNQNGGLLGVMSNWLTKFKKTSVAASLSVVVQQPTAILRAISEIDARYFMHLPSTEKLSAKWERIQKYAPIAIIKDIGGFDAGSGRQITEWLNADTRQGVTKAMNKLDDFTMYGAALGDRVGWGSIWTAVEREVQVKQNLKYGTEEFWQACGERFTEVIVKTQVYDSTLSRSGFMRGKDGLLKMATAFMGEPTLSVNMLADAVLQGKRGTMKKRQVVRTVAAVYTATIAASLIKSLIYALRDDDEDESYAEKYLQAFGGTILNDVNPLSMLPVFRDVVSILDGWDVERTDMAIVQDLYNAITALDSENKTTWRKIEDLAGALGALAGVPAKNLLRTAREMYNAINDIVDGIEGGDLGGAFVEGITGKEKTKAQTLYEALIGGEAERISALRDDYESEKEYMAAVRVALRKCDPRIKKAAQAYLEGDLITRNEIMLEILGEGVFDKETVDRAIDAELQAIKPEDGQSESDSKWDSVYSPSDIPLAFDNCSDELALEIIAELSEIKIEEKVSAAKTKAEAKGEKFDEDEAREDAENSVRSTLRSSLTKHYKPLYQAAYASGDRDEMNRIKNVLKTSGLYVFKTKKTIDDVLEEWIEE